MSHEEKAEERKLRPGHLERRCPGYVTGFGMREAVVAADYTFGPSFATVPTASRRTPMLVDGAGVPDLLLASGFARTSAPETSLDEDASKEGGGVGASDFTVLTGFAEAPTTTGRQERKMGRSRSGGADWKESGGRRGWMGDAGTRGTFRALRAPSPRAVT